MKILIAGLGAIGQRHARNLRRLGGDGFELLAYRERGRSEVISETLEVEAGSGLEQRYGIRPFSDLDAALAERPQAALVTNPTSRHLEVALRAAQAGCHVFVEKPLGGGEAGVEELCAEVEMRGLVGCVGYQLRFHPAFEQTRMLLEQGRPGRLLGVRAAVGESLATAHPYEDHRQSYAARAELGGGVLLGLSHEFDYLYAWLGRPRRAFALGGRLGGLDTDVEDVASVLFDFERDGRPLPVHVHLDYVQRPPLRTCELLGDQGRIECDFRGFQVEDVRPDGNVRRWQQPAADRNEMFLAELRHFLACIRGTDSPRVGLRDGAVSLRMALAARESLRTGQPVAVAP